MPDCGIRRSAVTTICLGLATIAAAGEPLREVSFDTADGAKVYADLYGGTSGDAVVLAHGAAFDRASWRGFAGQLAARGHRVMAIDFRGYGKSTAGAAKEARFEDILAAVRYLRGLGVRRVAVVGASMGGGAAAEAATRPPGDIDRLVLLSPVPIEHPERIGGRKLFIASAHEPAVERVKEQYDRAPEPKRLLLLPGTAHAQHIFTTDQAERLTTEIDAFVAAQ